MFGYAKAGRHALGAVTGLAAMIAFAAPAMAAGHQPVSSSSHPSVSPSACAPVAVLERDEHTGQVYAEAYASCPVNGPASMLAGLLVDNRLVKSASRSCTLRTNCDVATGLVRPSSGRHLYCAEAVFSWASEDPSQDDWSCEYLG